MRNNSLQDRRSGIIWGFPCLYIRTSSIQQPFNPAERHFTKTLHPTPISLLIFNDWFLRVRFMHLYLWFYVGLFEKFCNYLNNGALFAGGSIARISPKRTKNVSIKAIEIRFCAIQMDKISLWNLYLPWQQTTSLCDQF